MAKETSFLRDEQAFVGLQTAWDVIKQPVAGDAFLFEEVKLEPVIDKENDRPVGTRSAGASIITQRRATWSAKILARGSGVAATPPDAAPFFKAHFGVETIGANVVWSFIKDLENVVNGLTITHFRANDMAMVKNAIVQEIGFSFAGSGEKTSIDLKGEATTYIVAGTTTIATTAGAGSATIGVAVGHGKKFSKDAVIKVNGVGGHLITSVVGDVLTVTPSVVAAQVIGQAVIPDQPTGTTSGSVITGSTGAFSYKGTPYKIISGSVTSSDPVKLRTDEYGDSVPSGFDTGGNRSIKMNVTMRLLTSNDHILGDAFTSSQGAVIVDIGNVSGSRYKISMPAFEGDPVGIGSPGQDEAAMFEFTGEAKPTANENEMTLTHD